ncbi:MAG TPA: LamG-like jellyroll fold domain-containing protein [Planctomycetota bacterium]|nr:LamG-like jellyroll fold domain-containing protein [Planctomycetota bacterium]
MRVVSIMFVRDAILLTSVLLHFAMYASTVTGMTPVPGATLTDPPSSIVITVDSGAAGLDTNSVNPLTVRLTRAGPDGIMGTADDVNVPAALSIASGDQITLDLTGATLPSDSYRVVINGGQPAATNGLIASWKFDEANGASVADSSGNGNTGTLFGSTPRVPGLAKNAVRFNAPTFDLMKATSNVTLEPANGFTFGVWANITSAGSSYMDILRKAGGNGYLMRWNGDDGQKLNLRLSTSGGNLVIINPQTNGAYVNAWHHYAGTYDSATGTACLYVDGIQVATGSVVAGATLLHSSDDLYLMDSSYAGTVGVPGTLDDALLYNRALSAAEIAVLAKRSIVDNNGVVLDGEFSGTFPSGDGTAGGDFVAQFQIATPLLKIAAMSPAPNSTSVPVNSSVVLTTTTPLSANAIGMSTVKIVRAGADGVLGTADDVVVTPTGLSVLNQNQLKIDLPLQSALSEKYSVTVWGTETSATGMVAYYKFDETAGSVAADSSGNGKNATLTGTGAAFGAGLVRGAVSLTTASTVAIDDPTVGSFGTSDFTAMAWIKTTSVSTRILSNRHSNFHSKFWEVQLQSNGTLAAGVDENGNNYIPLPGNTVVNTGQWMHVAFVRNGTQIRLYVNGILDGTADGTGPADVTNGGATQIGNNFFFDDSSRFAGLMDDVRLFARALTADEIAALCAHTPLTDTTRQLLDGEFPVTGGSLPSGDGTPGGDFTASFEWDILATTVASIPAAATYGSANVTLNATVLASQSVDAGIMTFQLTDGTNAIGTGVSGGVSQGSASVTYPIPAGTAAGTYSVVVTFNGSSGFQGSTDTSQHLTINAAPLSLAVDPKTRLYGAANPALTGVLTGKQYNDAISVTYTTSAMQNSNVGQYPINPAIVDPQNNLTNYTLNISPAKLSVLAAPLTITPNTINRVYGAPNPDLTGTIAGLLNNDPINATYATSATAASPVGVYQILPETSDPAGKLANYNVTINAAQFIVNKAPLTVIAFDDQRKYGAQNPVFIGIVNGVVNGDNLTASYSSVGVDAPVGSYPIVPTLNDPDGKLLNYTSTLTNGTLTVSTAPLMVTAANASRPFGTPEPAFTGTLAGVVNDDAISATYSTDAQLLSPVGNYAIIPTLLDPANKLSNYTVTMVNGTLSIGAPIAPQLTSPLTASAVVGSDFEYTISADGSAPLSFTAAGLPADIALSGNVISGTPTVAGIFSVTLGVENGTGSNSKILLLTVTKSSGNRAPTIVSLPAASSNPAAVHSPITFGVTAEDADGDSLYYTWDWGDGTSAAGSTAAKSFDTPGVYRVTVTVSDGVAMDSASLDVVVAPAPGVFTVDRLSFSFSFVKPNKDSLSISGKVTLPAGFTPMSKSVRLLIGSLDYNGTLTSKGTTEDKAFNLKGQLSVSRPAMYSFVLKNQALFAKLTELGFRQTTNAAKVDVPLIVVIDCESHLSTKIVDYKIKTKEAVPQYGVGR